VAQGTGISLSGTSNATYGIVVDGTDSTFTPIQDLLFATANLELKTHIITLTVLSNDESQLLFFANASLTTSRCADAACTQHIPPLTARAVQKSSNQLSILPTRPKSNTRANGMQSASEKALG